MRAWGQEQPGWVCGGSVGRKAAARERVEAQGLSSELRVTLGDPCPALCLVSLSVNRVKGLFPPLRLAEGIKCDHLGKVLGTRRA